MKTSVLITGISGFVGQHLDKYLNTTTDWKINPELKNRSYDYIINLASGSSVEKSIKDPVEFIENNVRSILQVLEFAREHPPKLLIHMSTVEVYDSSSPYAASKTAQEAIVTAYHNTYGIPVVIATSHNIIGDGQAPEKFIPTLVRKISAGEMVSIYTQAGSMGSRTYNPVINVCDGLKFILGLPFTGLTRYAINGGEELTNLEMAEKIAKLLGKELKYDTVDAGAVRPGYTRHLIGTGIRLETLGWKPPQTLEEGLSWV